MEPTEQPQAPLPKPLSESQGYRLEEYRALRKEVEIYLAESRSQERYTLIAVGLISAWLLTNHVSNGWLWCVPFILTVATTVRMAGILVHFNNLNAYFVILEKAFGVKGWEQQERGWSLGAAYLVLNVVLLILTGAAAYLHRAMGSLIPVAPPTTCVQQGAPPVSTAPVTQPTQGGARVGPAALYPNASLTPGLADTLNVNDLTKRYTVHCPAGKADCTYSQSHRDVPGSVHDQIYNEYAVPADARNIQHGEVDHFYPLCAGGANDGKNLWYQPAENMWNGKNFGYHEKDNLEQYICRQIVAKQLDPREAYRRLTTDWVAWYLELGLGKAPEGVDEETD